MRVSVCVRVPAVGQNRIVDQRRVVEALHVELGSVLVCVAGVGAWRRLGAGGGGGMGMGWGVHVEEWREPGVYTHLSARYRLHCKTTGQ